MLIINSAICAIFINIYSLSVSVLSVFNGATENAGVENAGVA